MSRMYGQTTSVEKGRWSIVGHGGRGSTDERRTVEGADELANRKWVWPGPYGPGHIADLTEASVQPALIGIFTALCSVSAGIGTRTVSTPLS